MWLQSSEGNLAHAQRALELGRPSSHTRKSGNIPINKSKKIEKVPIKITRSNLILNFTNSAEYQPFDQRGIELMLVLSPFRANIEPCSEFVASVKEILPGKDVFPSMGNHEAFPCNIYPSRNSLPNQTNLNVGLGI